MTLSRWATRISDAILDPTILLSFDRNGYRRHARSFAPGDLECSLRGRTFAITGANSGLGFATAKALAERDANVWMLCRSQERGEDALKRIRDAHPEATLSLVRLDLASPESVSTLEQRLPDGPLDGLIHNAGILPREYALSEWGIEATLATNLVAPFALTLSLLPRLEMGERARMIWVSSGGMYTQRLDVAKLDAPEQGFDGVIAYARTKRAMVVLAEELAERLKDKGIAVHSMHPGWADTPGVATSIPGFWKLTQAILRTPEEGADTLVWLAATDHAQDEPGLFWFDRKARSTHLLGKHEAQSERSALWTALHRWAQVETAFP